MKEIVQCLQRKPTFANVLEDIMERTVRKVLVNQPFNSPLLKALSSNLK